MQRSSDRILTTHTGSLPLPAGVREQLAAKRRGRGYDQAAIDSALTTAVGVFLGTIGRRLNENGVVNGADALDSFSGRIEDDAPQDRSRCSLKI